MSVTLNTSNVFNTLNIISPKLTFGLTVPSGGSSSSSQPDLTGALGALQGFNLEGIQSLIPYPKFGGLGPEVPNQQGGILGGLEKIKAEVEALENQVEQMLGGGDQAPSPMDQIQDGAEQVQRGRGELRDARSSEKDGIEKLFSGDLEGAIADFQSAESSRKAGHEDIRAGREEAEQGFQAEMEGQGSQQSPFGDLLGKGPSLTVPLLIRGTTVQG